jgi:hypothetical protein
MSKEIAHLRSLTICEDDLKTLQNCIDKDDSGIINHIITLVQEHQLDKDPKPRLMPDPTNVYEDNSSWCECEEDHGTRFFDDGVLMHYGDHNLPVNKHHYACCECQKLKQIG